MRSVFVGVALLFATQSVALPQVSRAAWSGQVDWARLGAAFAAYVDYPSDENAHAVRALLPAVHVAFNGSATQKATSDSIEQWEPMLGRQVEARDPEAVRLAFDLYVVTDGATEEQLDIMLGKLIRIDPTLFLSELKQKEQRIGALGGLPTGNLGEEYVDRMRAQCLEMRLRVTSLERVHEPALRTVKTRCIEALNYDIRKYCR